MKIVEADFKKKNEQPKDVKKQMIDAVERLFENPDSCPVNFVILTLDGEGNGIVSNTSLPVLLYLLEAAKVDLLFDDRG